MIPTKAPQYTGVDKLLWAAMVEESAAAAALAENHHHHYHHGSSHSINPIFNYIPHGRGIGYGVSNARDSQIPTPSNKSELELYRLLERANLLNYFGTFLNFGGDDVRQLSEADEDEFLEIMSLVGMTQKPLHVRRLQKALIEWRENKELENSFHFRRPSQLDFSSNNASLNNSNNSNHTRQQLINQAFQPESPAPTPTSSLSQQSVTVASSNNDSRQGNNQLAYVSPHDVLIGAPKRPRLMDNLHSRDTPQDERTPASSPKPN